MVPITMDTRCFLGGVAIALPEAPGDGGPPTRSRRRIRAYDQAIRATLWRVRWHRAGRDRASGGRAVLRAAVRGTAAGCVAVGLAAPRTARNPTRPDAVRFTGLHRAGSHLG